MKGDAETQNYASSVRQTKHYLFNRTSTVCEELQSYNNVMVPKTAVTIPKTAVTIPKTAVTIPKTAVTIPKTAVTIPKTAVTIPKMAVKDCDEP